jgi:hypothetical protein
MPPRTETIVWFWRTVSLPDKWKKRSVRIRVFEGPEKIELWVNGAQTGQPVRSTGTLRPTILDRSPSRSASAQTFDITGLVGVTSPNLIALRVPADATPAALVEVSAMAADEAYIEDVTVDASVTDWVSLRVALRNTSDKSGDAELEAAIIDRTKPKSKLSRAVQRIAVSPGLNRADMLLRFRPPKSNGTTRDYAVEVQFRQGKDLLDNETVRLE